MFKVKQQGTTLKLHKFTICVTYFEYTVIKSGITKNKSLNKHKYTLLCIICFSELRF